MLQKFYKALSAVYNEAFTEKKGLRTVLKNEFKMYNVNQLIVKANEANSTGQAGYGQEFVVPTMLLNNVAARVQETESLLSFIPEGNQFPSMPSDPYTVPVKWAKIRMFWAAENPDVPGVAATKNKVKTAKITLTTWELATTVYVSYDLLEDSAINFADYIEMELAEAYETSLHQFIVNGDSASVSNVNGTYDATADWAQNASGLRKTAIANQAPVNAWTLDLADLRACRAQLGLKGMDPTKLLYIMNSNVYYKILGLAEVKTQDVFWLNATIVNWTITHVDWVKVLVRNEMPALTNSNGLVDTTGWNNTVWSMLLVHTPSVYLWFKRQLMVETDKATSERQIFMTASTRPACSINQNDGFAVALIANITL